jgi:DUF4097 and DUF4098 domain-containing protein YvlB
VIPIHMYKISLNSLFHINSIDIKGKFHTHTHKKKNPITLLFSNAASKASTSAGSIMVAYSMKWNLVISLHKLQMPRAINYKGIHQ